LNYVVRTGMTTWDYLTASFTRDGNIYSKNVSAIVPVDAQMIKCRVYVKGDAVGSSIIFGGPSVTTITEMAGIRTSYISDYWDLIVDIPVEGQQSFKYRASSVNISTLNMIILGWWL